MGFFDLSYGVWIWHGYLAFVLSYIGGKFDYSLLSSKLISERKKRLAAHCFDEYLPVRKSSQAVHLIQCRFCFILDTILFIQLLNDTIDLATRRLAAFENHIPDLLMWLLFASAILALALVGYGQGVSSHRNLVLVAMLSILVVMTIFVIIDLDRPRRGLIQVSQASMLELRENLNFFWDEPPSSNP